MGLAGLRDGSAYFPIDLPISWLSIPLIRFSLFNSFGFAAKLSELSKYSRHPCIQSTIDQLKTSLSSNQTYFKIIQILWNY